MKREKSCGAIIFRKAGKDVEYLLLHYKAGHWDFVKGHVEKGETEESTLRRETKEETGINDLDIIDGFREKIRYFFHEKDKKTGKNELIFKEVIFLLAETKSKDVKVSFEHIGYKWLGFDEASKQLTFKNAKDVLVKANDFLNKNKGNNLNDFVNK